MDADEFDELMKFQRMMAQRIVTETDTDTKITVLNTIQDLNVDKRGRFKQEELLMETRAQGLQDSEVLRILESLKSDGMIRDLGGGFFMQS